MEINGHIVTAKCSSLNCMLNTDGYCVQTVCLRDEKPLDEVEGVEVITK